MNQTMSQPAALGFSMEGLRRGYSEAEIEKAGAVINQKLTEIATAHEEKRASLRKSIAESIKQNLKK
jgi:hypothetical protein